MADSLTYIETDLSNSIGGVVAANGINVLRVEAHLDTIDTDAYCILSIGFSVVNIYNFRLINKSFDGNDGEFYIDLSDILPYIFENIADDELTDSVQVLVDTFAKDSLFSISLYSETGTLKGYLSGVFNILFAAPYFNSENGTYLKDWEDNIYPTYLAQKNKTSYIYTYNLPDYTTAIYFEKVDYIPEEIGMIDNYDMAMVDNEGALLTYLN